jgi:hypothetical protein
MPHPRKFGPEQIAKSEPFVMSVEMQNWLEAIFTRKPVPRTTPYTQADIDAMYPPGRFHND